MDNLKKNFHFVVLGGGVLLGIILVVVGIMIRGGTEDQLAEAQQQLQSHANVYTRGTLDDVEKRASQFGTLVEQAEGAITEAKGFEADYLNHTSGNAFYTNEANRKLEDLRRRWDALAGKDKMPVLVQGWTMKRVSGNENADGFWDRLATNIANPPQDAIRGYQRQFRILEEVLATCEHLVSAGHGQGMGVKLLDFKAEGYQPLTTNKLDSPWMVMQWEMDIECAPAFAVLLFDELVNPSALTMGEKEGLGKRRGFPMLPMNLQTEMIERPGELKVQIENDGKAGLLQTLRDAGKSVPSVSEPKNLDPSSGDGKQVVDTTVELLEGDEQIVLPVRAGLRMQAAGYNPDWRATNAPEDTE